MSRPTMAKSRVDKGKSVPAPTPAHVQDIVPGKLNEQDWNFLLDRDDGDDFIAEIVGEVCSSALDIIYKAYLERQLVPYTVSQAKDAIVQIIQWEFLSRDEGEGDVSADSGWLEDEEPAPGTTDCWAQGSVPKQIISPRELAVVIEESDQTEDQSNTLRLEDTETTTPSLPMGGVPHERTIIEEESNLMIEGTSIPAPEKSDQEIQSQADVKRKKKFKPHFGPLKSAGLGKMTESLEKSEMELCKQQYMKYLPPEASPDPQTLNMPSSVIPVMKLQAGRPPGKRDIFYDEYGNVVKVKRIHPHALPNHRVAVEFDFVDVAHTKRELARSAWKPPDYLRVQTKFTIVDPEVEAAQERLDAMRTGKYIKKAPKTESTGRGGAKSRGNMSVTTRTHKTGVTSYKTGLSNKSGAQQPSPGPRSPLPPPLVDSMVVAPGVVVRDGNRVKRGKALRPREEELFAYAIHGDLHKVTLHPAQVAITANEILENRTPVVKPLVDQSPIPPIPTPEKHYLIFH